MSSLITTGPQSWTRPYAIYNGPRTGDEFLEWNQMGQITFVDPPKDLEFLFGLGRLYDMGQIDQLFGAATNAFGSAVESIEFRSQVTPPIIINQPLAPAGQRPAPQVQGGTPLTTIILDKAAKPAMYIHLKGGIVYPVEPYGKPTEDYTGLMIGGIGVTLAIGALVGIKIGQFFFCSKKK